MSLSLFRESAYTFTDISTYFHFYHRCNGPLTRWNTPKPTAERLTHTHTPTHKQTHFSTNTQKTETHQLSTVLLLYLGNVLRQCEEVKLHSFHDFVFKQSLNRVALIDATLGLTSHLRVCICTFSQWWRKICIWCCNDIEQVYSKRVL